MWESTNIVIGTVTGSEPVIHLARRQVLPGVENASRMSPLECSPAPPVRPIPSEARWASRRHWCGSSGASVATITMIEPAPAACRGVLVGIGHDVVADHPPDRHARDRRAARGQPWLACTSTPTV